MLFVSRDAVRDPGLQSFPASAPVTSQCLKHRRVKVNLGGVSELLVRKVFENFV